MFKKTIKGIDAVIKNPALLIPIVLLAIIIRIILIEHFSLIYGRDIARELTAVYVKLDFIKNFNYSNYTILDLPSAFRAQNLHWWLPEGPIISTTWQNLSPLYYITFAPIFILTGFLYTTSIYISIFTNILGLVLMYFFSKKYFGIKTAVIATLIYTFSYFNIKESLAGLNHSFVPPFTMLLLFSIYEIYKNKSKYIYLTCFSIVGLLSYHASGFFIMPVLAILLLYKIKIFRLIHYFLGGLILLIGLFPYYLQEKMIMNRNINTFIEYFINKNSPLLKKVPFFENQFNFYSVFSTTFGQYIFPNTPIIVGYLLTLLLIVFCIYKIIKKENYLICTMLLVYLITFSLSAKFYIIVFMGWWFYGMALPMAIIIFSNFLSQLSNKKNTWVNILLILFVLAFAFFNIRALYKNLSFEAIQQYKNARYIAKIIGKDTKKDNFKLYFRTKMEGESQINTPTPFVYLVAYNSQNKDLFLKSELRPSETNFKFTNVYIISDILDLKSNQLPTDVYNKFEKDYKGVKKPILIFQKNNYSIYKAIFLNTKIQTAEQKMLETN